MSGGDRGGYHPSSTELERFMLGELPPGETRQVLAHLLHGCDQCQAAMSPLAVAMFLPSHQEEEVAVEAGAEYEFPIFRALASAKRASALARSNADGAFGAFPKEVPALEEPSSESTLPKVLCERLLATCHALRHRDPEAMVLAATMATGLAERLEQSDVQGPKALADLRARAWAELGNARRVANDPNGSEADFARALRQAAQGTGDPLLLARLMDLAASLYIAQRRFNEAFRLLDWVYQIYQREGDAHSAGRALIKKGISAGYALDSEQAVYLLGQGLGLIDAACDPKLVLSAVHNLVWCLVDCGRLDEANRLLSKSRNLYRTHAERLDELKARWVEGRIAAGFGDEEEAERAFLEVREGYEEAELSYDAALVSLDLAAIWLHRGQTAEIRSLIDEMLVIFRARNIHREAIGALLMLREAFERDRATVTLLRNVASELQRLDREPTRRSRPEL
jgi:tetratricopeptide (TPR) repeat protein